MRFLSLFALLFFSYPAQAQDGCYDADPVVDITQTWDLKANPRSDFYLPSHNTFGTINTRAAAHVSGGNTLRVDFDYHLPPGLTGLQYTVHRMEIQVGAFTYSQDFTFSCTNPGASFFPGESIVVPAVGLPPQTVDESGIAPVRIRVWGHL